jgi:hypothetical protein
MKSILKVALSGALLLAANLHADDLGNSRHVLCSNLNVNACQNIGVCSAVLPADLNIPQFIEVDTKTGALTTTAASGENRETTASQVVQSDDHVLIHGDQLGRAYTLLIQKSTGQASFASVSEGDAVVVFAACTPRND